MNFRTEIPLQPQEPKIDYHSKILLLGSCFVENIGRKLDYYKFETLQNPFGILFHPAAICNFLKRVESISTSPACRRGRLDVTGKTIFPEELFFHNERWHSFEAHSALSSPDKEKLLRQLNCNIRETHIFLQKASHVIITLGTAWAYTELKSNKIVANCHKLPQKNFSKELTDVDEDLSAMVEIIKTINPTATIIFTVSPVRHLKDGFVENQRSKAKLITAIHEIVQDTTVPTLGARGLQLFYFPSYEIMMDELRDYRFYSEDMIHPNSTAIDYIWEKFVLAWMDPKADTVMKKVEKIQKSLAHKAFYEDSAAHEEFKNNLQEKIEVLKKEFPYMHF